MNRRDRELLDKQLRGLNLPPRHDGVMALAIFAVFLAGMALGGLVFAHKSVPMQQIAANDVTPAISVANDAPSITWH